MRGLDSFRAVRSFAQKSGSHVFHLGDVWHVKGALPVREYLAFLRELDEWEKAGLNLTIMVGNHDFATADGREHTLSAMKDRYKFVRVVDEPTTGSFPDGTTVALLPYRPRPQDLTEWLKAHAGHKYVFMHHGIVGAVMNSGDVDNDGVDGADLDPQSRYFSGHYHKHQKVGAVQFVGSPYQTNFGEEGERKGFIDLNLEDGSFQHRRLMFPEHKTIKIDLDGDPKADLRAAILALKPHEKFIRLKVRAQVLEGRRDEIQALQDQVDALPSCDRSVVQTIKTERAEVRLKDALSRPISDLVPDFVGNAPNAAELTAAGLRFLGDPS